MRIRGANGGRVCDTRKRSIEWCLLETLIEERAEWSARSLRNGVCIVRVLGKDGKWVWMALALDITRLSFTAAERDFGETLL